MLAAKEINDRARPSLKEGMQHFNGKATVRFTDAPFVRTADSMLLIEEVCFEGIVERLTTQMPTAYKALVKHGESKPFAGCCISDFGTWGLIGLIVTDDRTIQLASIPVAARNKSKIFREKVN